MFFNIKGAGNQCTKLKEGTYDVTKLRRRHLVR